ncbi:uncharacterized protein LOC133183606 [Saccostrea echinata]|uniref:uncharacterized protein LOC133183606 n=1 Tax=Saccostrea echinata TaxID=191078 RepID=UPI002A818B4C|nr:uncharacterized protein LOC133183606 [Saccostrea echinata]
MRGTDSQPDFEQKVDGILKKVFECRNLTPGLTISVVKDGKVLMANGYGVTDVTTKRPVTNQTLFEIASMSKAFGATLLMKQIGRSGNLSAQSKIKELLGPTFTFADAERNRLADVNDILSQQLGIPGHYLMKLDLNLTRTNLLTRFKYLNGTKPLRQGFLYSGMNYALAMIISEHLGGNTWEELIKKEIFDPLGMSSSTVMSIIPDLSNAARGYVYTENFTLVPVEFALSRQWAVLASASGIASNAVDMTKWMNFHLSGGLNDKNTIVMNSTLVEMLHAPRVKLPHDSKSWQPGTTHRMVEDSYAYGWKRGQYRGHTLLNHGGTSWGYNSFISLYPDVNTGIFTAVTGSDHYYMFQSALHNFLFDNANNITSWFNESILCNYPEPWYHGYHRAHHVDKTIHPSRPLTEYTGLYTNPAYGDVFIFMNKMNKLEMSYGMGSWILYPKHKRDQFSGSSTGDIYRVVELSTVEFFADGHGKINSVKQPSFDWDEPPVFVKSV